MIVSLTGHRSFNPSSNDSHRIALNKCILWIEDNKLDIDQLWYGGANGWDIEVAKEACRWVQVVAKLPYKNFNKLNLDNAGIRSTYDTFISPYYYTDCYKERNEILARANVVLAFYNPKQYASGTGQTVRMVEANSNQIINFYED